MTDVADDETWAGLGRDPVVKPRAVHRGQESPPPPAADLAEYLDQAELDTWWAELAGRRSPAVPRRRRVEP